MNWADEVNATALAAPSKRAATADGIVTDSPWSWNPRDVWLTRPVVPRLAA